MNVVIIMENKTTINTGHIFKSSFSTCMMFHEFGVSNIYAYFILQFLNIRNKIKYAKESFKGELTFALTIARASSRISLTFLILSSSRSILWALLTAEMIA